MSAPRLLFCALLFCGTAARTVAAPPTGSEYDAEKVLGAERNALIARIVRGDDLEGLARGYAKLLQRREELRIAAEQAIERERQEAAARQAALLAEKEQAARAAADKKLAEQRVIEAERARHREEQAYQRSLDFHASRYCHLSVDPRERHFAGGLSADWGRVARKTEVVLPPKDLLHSETRFFIYEIDGVRERHVVRGDYGQRLQASVGELIFLCYGPANADRHLPPPWNVERLTSPLYSGRIAAPPRIASKERWRPIHIVMNRIHDAIRSVKWPFPVERPVLIHLRIGPEISAGRFEIETINKSESFLVEVPPALPRRELFRTGQWLWVILEQPRFDADLKKLVLVAADVESRYITEAPP